MSYSLGFNEMFKFYYDFMSFQRATGLQALKLADAYKDFKDFAWQLVKENILADSIMSEVFESWAKQTAFLS